MRSRTPVRTVQQLKATQLELAGTVSLVLARAVQKLIRSKRAILASKSRLAAMRRKSHGKSGD